LGREIAAMSVAKTFLDFLLHHWYFAILLFGMSFSGIALVIWRLLLNFNGTTNMNEFLPIFQQKLEKEGIDGAIRYCKSRTDYIPRRLYLAGLETSKQGMAAMRRAMANVIELEIIPDLNFLLPTILAIAKIATMVGLLGTVLSMIGVFAEMSKDSSNTQAQGGQIGLALWATALGLVCAIPLVFTHVLFKAWVAKFETRLKSSAQKLIILVQAAKPGAAIPTVTAAGPAKPAATGQTPAGIKTTR
jgi:biopolymer transport protein ExbB